SWRSMARSRSSVARRIEGHANFFRMKKSAMKTAQVQKKRPKLTSKGDNGAPATGAASSVSRVGIVSPSDQLEEQREHERDDRSALEEHRDEQRRAADVARRFRLPRDRFRR